MGIRGQQIAALKKWLGLHFIEPSSTIVVNHIMLEEVMKFVGLKNTLIHPNNSHLGVLYMLLSLTYLTEMGFPIGQMPADGHTYLCVCVCLCLERV